MPLVLWAVVGIDHRLGWSLPLSMLLQGAAFLGVVVGYTLGTRAMAVNPLSSGTVRVQKERGHQVISAGPYGYLRHPAYAGASLAKVYLSLSD